MRYEHQDDRRRPPGRRRAPRWRALFVVALGLGPGVVVAGGTAAAAGNCQIFSSPSTGSHSVCGAILAKYQSLGATSSFLGYPTTDETGTSDGVGRYNDFASHGAIYWTPSTGAWSLHGAILQRWTTLGAERSPLGYPVTDEQPSPDGRMNAFQAARLDWNATTFAVTREYGANPLRGITNLRSERIDEGVDYGGSGPVYAVGPGVVINVHNAGWAPRGTFICYRLTTGPRMNMVVYVAENVVPDVTVGQRVDTGTAVGQLINAYPDMETGWADPAGNGNTLAHDKGQTVYPTAEGQDFNQFLISLGAPGGT